MSDKPFLDTTILIYSVSDADPRALTAKSLIASGGNISVQVLNEFAAVARRKLKRSWPEIASALAAIRSIFEPPSPLTVETHESGVRIADRYGLNIYDALIVASALEAGCTILYSEDMQDGQVIDGLTIRNPFV